MTYPDNDHRGLDPHRNHETPRTTVINTGSGGGTWLIAGVVIVIAIVGTVFYLGAAGDGGTPTGPAITEQTAPAETGGSDAATTGSIEAPAADAAPVIEEVAPQTDARPAPDGGSAGGN